MECSVKPAKTTPMVQTRNQRVPRRRFETVMNITHFAILDHNGWASPENATFSSSLTTSSANV